MEPVGFDILFEEGALLVVVKPSGVLTQAPPGIDSLETRVKRFIKSRDEKPGNVYLGVPHRLDRPVSGVMVLAKNSKIARRLSEQFEARTIDKTYWAVVEGVPLEESGTWVDHIRKVPDLARSEVVAEDDPDGRNAILHYKVLKTQGERSLLEIRLETGRTHQIRVQASSRGFPILGDVQYHSSLQFGPETDNERKRCIALHARQISLQHPKTRDPVTFVAELPRMWSELEMDIEA